VRDSQHHLTYAQLWERSGRLASALARRGVGRGHLVPVAMARSTELAVALLGIARSGAAYVALDHAAPAAILDGILTETAAPLVVCAEDQAAQFQLPADTPRLTVYGLQPADLDVPTVPTAPVEPGDPLYVNYTSGSTGRPKGVVIPHGAALALVEAGEYCTIGPDDVVGGTCNPAFDVTTFEVWSTLTAGATLVALPGPASVAASDWAALLRRERISVMFLTSALFAAVALEASDAFASLRVLLTGGEAVDIEAVRRVLDTAPPAELLNMYGPTEATTYATFFRCTPHSIAGRERTPIGHPLEHVTASVVDAELRPVAAGTPGELVLGGPSVAAGYLERPELTAQKFLPAPQGAGEGPERLYRTGDLVVQGADGALEFLGRIDREVKLRGFRIELEAVESALLRTGLVAGAAVEKVGDGAAAKLVGFIVPSAGPATPDLAQAAVDRLREELPAHMVPSEWSVLGALPVNAIGKLDRKKLLEQPTRPAGKPVLAAPLHGPSGDGDGAPDDRVLDTVLAVCRNLLGVQAAPDDNYVELGGNSIRALQAASRLKAQLGVDVKPGDVLFGTSLRELALQLSALVSDGAEASQA
jgi:amino acid adenylation domain-containing protein